MIVICRFSTPNKSTCTYQPTSSMKKQILFKSSRKQRISISNPLDSSKNENSYRYSYFNKCMGKGFFLLAFFFIASFSAFGQYDITVDHTVDNPTPTIGSTVTFTIVVSNLDGDTAKNVILTDSLSPCLTDITNLSLGSTYSAATGSATYNATTHAITWLLEDLDTTEVTTTLTFDATVACEGVSFSKAEITTPLVDANDSDATPSNYNYGEDDIATACISVPIKICVTNKDTIELTAPTGATDVYWYRVYDADGSGGLSVGDTVPYPTSASTSTIDITMAGTYYFESTYEGCDAGLCCPFVVEEACMDLALTKTITSAGPYSVGDTVDFAVTVYNQGDINADSILVYDYLPDGFNLVAGDGWTSVNDSTAYQLLTVADGELSTGGLAPSQSTVITLSAQIDPTFTDSILINFAEIAYQTDTLGVALLDSDSEPDSTRTNDAGGDPESDADDYVLGDGTGTVGGSTDTTDEDDHDPALVRVEQVFDLALMKELSSTQTSPVTPGSNVTYTVTVVNQGSLAADSITIMDYIPSDMNYVSNPTTIVTSSNGVSTTITEGTINGEFGIDTLAAGDTVRFDITLQVDPSFTGTSIDNWAEISQSSNLAGLTDEDSTPDGTNFNQTGETNDLTDDNIIDNTNGDEDDHDPARIAVTQTFDLALMKDLSAGQATTVTPGDTVSFTITIINQGSVPADSINVQDYVPTDMVYLSNPTTMVAATPSGYNTTVSELGGGAFAIDTLSAGDTIRFTVDLEVSSTFTGTSITNWAEISYATNPNGQTDEDSTPDATNFNQTGETNDLTDDNIIDNTNGDEDDHDPAQFTVSQLSCAITGTDLTCNGDNSGDLTVTLTGSSTPFDYAWNDSNLDSLNIAGNTYEITGLAAGTYMTTVTDNLGSTATCSIILTEPAALPCSITGAAEVCGNSTSMVYKGPADTGGYTYTWSVAGTGTTIQSSAADSVVIDFGTADATITLILSDGTCSSTCTYSVTVNPLPSCTINKQDITCNGSIDGEATVVPSGGLAGYTYLWSNGQTTATVTGLTAGDYKVTVTDFNGCLDSCMVTIIEPDTLACNLAITNITCNGAADGTITATASGGTGSYEYSLNGGAYQPGNIFTSLAPGTHSITIKDANGCTFVCDTTLIQPAALTCMATPTDASNCSTNDGQISIAGLGGTGAYEYSLNGGTYQSGNTFTNLSGGSYTVTIRDVNGCTSECTATVNTPSAPACTIISSVNVDCFGNSTGSLTVAGQNGTGTYDYSIDGITFHTVTGADTTFATLAAGSYTVTVRNTGQSLCTSTCNITITQPATLTCAIVGVDASCDGGSDGSATVTPTGGTAGYTYLWDTNASSQTTATATGLAAGTYGVTVTDDNSCATSCTVMIGDPAPIVLDTIPTHVHCNGASSGAIDLDVTGGTGPYTYDWDIDGPDTPDDDVQDPTGLAAGTYTVTVTDANGCTVIAKETLTEPLALTCTATPTDETDCGAADGTIQIAGSDGTAPYSYSYDGTTFFAVVGTDTTFQNLAAGSYTLTVRDANGCTSTCSATINNPTAPTCSTALVGNVSCNSGMDGSFTVTAAGGSGSYEIDINGGGFNAISGTDSTFQNLSAGFYTIKVRNAGTTACESSCTIIITEPTDLSCTATKTDVSCNGGADGTATVAPTGGTAGYTYAWDSSPAQTTATASNLAAGNYKVIITDANGCIDSCTVLINEPVALTCSLLPTDASCNGSSDGKLTVTGTGGTVGYEYSLSGGPYQPGNVFTGLAAGTYSVTIKDANGCTNSCSATINQPTPVICTIIATTDESDCGAGDGTIRVDGSGGTGLFDYSIDGTTFYTVTGADTTFANLTAGNYTLTVRDANGCISTCIASLAAPSAPVCATLATNVSCNAGSDGTIKLSGTGGSGTYEFSIDGGTTFGTSTSGIDSIFTGLAAGSYTLVLRNVGDAACTSTCTITLTEPTALTCTTGFTPTSCNSGSDGTATVVPANGTPNYSYQWDANASNQTTATATGLAANTYAVTVTDANGCETTCSVMVTEPVALTCSFTNVTNVSCKDGTDGSITVSGLGGTGTYEYSLDGGAYQPGTTFSNLVIGNYTITVKDANGCISTCNTSITEPTALSCATNPTNVSDCSINDGQIVVSTVSGGTPSVLSGYEYSLNGGTYTTNNTFTNLSAGSYIITVKDSLGCTSECAATLTAPSSPSCTITASTNVSCLGGNDGRLTVSGSGGSGSYDYSIDGTTFYTVTGADTTFATLAAGSYTVTVRNTGQNSCTSTCNITITEPTDLACTMSMTAATCNGTATGTASVSVTGGTSGYTYAWSSGQTTASVTGITAGYYKVIITDAKGCIDSCDITVLEPALLVCSLDSVNVSCNGGTDGQVNIGSVTGGTSPYEYNINGGTYQPGTNFSGLAAGTHSVTVKDANGCTSNCTIVINEPTPVTCTAFGTDESDCGANNGSISITGSGGTPSVLSGYMYSLNSGAFQTSNSFTSLSAGTYTLTVRDSLGCTSTCAATIGNPTAPSCTITPIANVSCNGAMDGTFKVTATGGSGSYELSINGGTYMAIVGTDSTYANLAAGTYTINVRNTGTTACESSCNIIITEPTSLSCSMTKVDATCPGNNDGSATVTTSGGTPGYTYVWSDGQTGVTASNLTMGTYKVTITDANTCIDTCEVTIIAPTALSCTLTTDSISCFSGADGKITVTGIGGTIGYEYSINGGTYQPGNVFTDLVIGSYTITIKDANGCISTCDTTLFGPAALTCTSTLVANESGCGAMDGKAYVTATGGEGPYLYAWSNGMTTDTIENIAGGTYTVTITDNNGCTTDCTISVSSFNCNFDLALNKSAVSVGPYTIGDTVEYAITVYNQGNMEATNITVEDYLPTNMLFVADASSEFSVSSGQVLASIASLPVGQDSTLTLFLEIGANAIGTLTNNAEITAADGPGGTAAPTDQDSDLAVINGSPNNATELGTDGDINDDGAGTPGTADNPLDVDDWDLAQISIDEFDLALTKEVTTPAPYQVGDQITFTITVYNQGSLAADSIVVEDYLPSNMTFVSSPDFVLTSGSYLADISSLAAGASTQLTIVASIDAGSTGTVTNNAEIIYADNDGDPTTPAPVDEDSPLTDISGGVDDATELLTDGNIEDEAAGTPGIADNPADEDDWDLAQLTIDTFDLALMKTINTAATTMPIVPGGTVTFNVTVYNQGTIPAYDINIQDYVPNGLTLTDSDWTMVGDTATLLNEIGVLAAGDNTVIPITFTVDANFQGDSLTNNAEIGFAADEDGGPMATDIDSDYSSEDGSTSDPNNDDIADATGGDDYDPAGISIEQTYDLALTKVYDSFGDADGDGAISAGDTVVYTITIYNQGTLDATNVAVTDYTPSDMIYPSTASINIANNWDATPSTTITNLSAGADTSVQIALIIDPTFQDTSIINNAEITGGTNALGLTDEDSTPSNDAGSTSEMATDNDIADDSNGGSDNPSDEDDFDPAQITVGQVFDLALIKSVNTSTYAGPYAPGDTVQFTITVYNQGSLDAYDVQLSDYIPTGLSLIDPLWEDTDADGIANLVTPIDTLSVAEGSESVDILFVIDANFQDSTLLNEAEVSFATAVDNSGINTPDVDSNADGINDDIQGADDEINNAGGDEDDHDPAQIMVEQTFDLALTKTFASSSATPIVPGSTVTFNITVYNQGTLDAYDINVNDYIPTGLILTDANWADNSGVATLNNEIPFIAANDNEVVSITFTVDPSFEGDSLTNNAEIGFATDTNGGTVNTPDEDSTPADQDGSTSDPLNDDVAATDGSDDYDPAGIAVEQTFDLSLTKVYDSYLDADGDGQISAGDTIIFTLTVANEGTIGADTVTITEYVPADMSYVSSSINTAHNWDATNIATPVTGLDTLAAGATASVQIALIIDPTFQGTSITNHAEITNDGNALNLPDEDSTPSDQVPTQDDYDTAEVPVGQVFDLALTKAYSTYNDIDADGSLSPGDEVTFEIVVYNQGSLDAYDVQVSDYIPTGLNLTDANWTNNGGIATLNSTIDTITVAEMSDTVSITFTVDPTFQDTSITNVAEISFATAVDNSGINTPDVDSGADGINGDVIGGDDLTDNTAGDEDDHDPATITIEQTFDVALKKAYATSSATPIVPGTMVTFNITVYNQGTVDAYDISVNDYIPTGLNLADADWTDNGGIATLNNVIGMIAPSDSITVPITFTVDANFQGDTITNVAEVGFATDVDGSTVNAVDEDSTPSDQDPTQDDQDTAGIPLEQTFDVALDKAYTNYIDHDNDGQISAGDDVIFDITVYNEGTVDADSISVSEYVPSSMSFIGTNPMNSIWSGSGSSVVTTAITNLAAGASTTVQVILQIDPAYQGASIVNNAEIVYGSNALGLDDTDSGNLPTTIDGSIDDTSELSNDGDLTAPRDDYDPAEVPVGQVFDLAIDKVVMSAGPFQLGDTVAYDIVVYNQGTLDATNIVVEDYLPSNMSFVSSTDFALVGTQYVDTLAMLAAGQDTTLSIVLSIDAVGTGTAINNAEITSANGPNGDPVTDFDNPLTSVTGSPDDESELTNDNIDDLDAEQITIDVFDLALNKMVNTATSPSPYLVGDTVEYTINVYNQGTIDADSIVVEDYLPSNMSFVSSPDFTLNGSSYTATIPTLSAGGMQTLSISLSIDSAAVGTVTNNAEIIYADDDNDPATTLPTDIDGDLVVVDGSSDDATELATDDAVNDPTDIDDWDLAQIEIEVFDLALTKTFNSSSTTPIAPGSTVTFNITVYNQGTLDAYDIQVNEYVPTGLTLQDTDWMLSGTTAILLNEIPAIPAGDNVVVPITFVVDANFQGDSITNNAEIAFATHEDGSGVNTPDVDSEYNSEEGTTPDSLNDDIADTNGGDDYDPEGIAIEQIFDLALNKIFDSYIDNDNDGQISAGDDIIYNVTVYNQGTLDADSVLIEDYVPAELIYTASDSINVINGWNADGTNYLGTVPAGTSQTVQVALMIDPNFQGSGIINNAEITRATNILGRGDHDSTPGDNSSTPSELNSDNDIADDFTGGADNPNDNDDYDPAAITVGQVFDLALTKGIDTLATPGPYAPGDTIQFAIEVFNQGSLDAYNVQVNEYIPAGLILVDPAWTSFLGTANLVSSIATIPADTSVVVTIAFQIDPNYASRTPIMNVAEISSADDDTNPSNGTATDIDSSPDGIPGNDVVTGDDTILNENGDEDDHDPAVFEVMQTFDLALDKSFSNSSTTPIVQGSTVTFNIRVTNEGTLDAYDVELKDYVPAGLMLADNDWTYSGGVATINNEIPFIAAGDDFVVPITFTVDANFQGDSIVNHAEISFATEENGSPVNATDIDSTPNDNMSGPDGTDDNDVEALAIQQTFDLALAKSFDSYIDNDNDGRVSPGDDVLFNITVSNEGSLNADSVTVVDYVPADMVYDPTLAINVANGWGAGPNPITTIASLAAGSSSTVQIQLQIDPAYLGTSLVNDAEIEGADNPLGLADEDSTPSDEDPTQDDYDAAEIPVGQVFDLALTKEVNTTATPGPYSAGSTITYTIEVINQGSIDAYDVQLSDYIPAGLILADSNWEDNDQDGVANLVTPIPDVLVSEGSELVDITFQIDPSFQGTNIVNVAEISFATETDGSGINTPDIDSNADGVNDDVQGDDNTVDNTGGDEDDHDPSEITVEQVFDLALNKTFNSSSATPIVPGSTVTYNITVYNQGTLDAYDVEINDYIPTGLTLTDSDWISNGGLATLLNEISMIPAGDDVVIPITFTVDANFEGASITNNAEIAFATDTNDSGVNTPDVDSQYDSEDGTTPDANDDDTTDTTGGDDYDPHTIEIEQVFDLALTKVYESYVDNDNDGQISTGDDVVFNITVNNEGTLEATNVAVTDYVSSDFIYDATASINATNGWGAGPNPTTTLGTIAVGGTATVQIQLEVNTTLTEIENRAEITNADNALNLPDTDSTPSDNSDTPSSEVDAHDDYDHAPIPVGQVFDLALTKVLDAQETPGPFQPGSQVTFTIEIFNQGTLDAYDVQINEYIPNGLVLSDFNWNDGNGDGIAQLLTPISFISAGSSESIDITFEIAADYQGTAISNVAEIGFATDVDGSTVNTEDIDSEADALNTDVVAGDNITDNTGGDEDDHDFAGITVEQLFDLALTKVVNPILSPAPYTAGDKVTFTITVYNQGTLDASDVIVADYVRSGFIFNPSDNSTFTTDNFGNVEATIDLLKAGESQEVSITLEIDPNYQGTGLTNDAEITGGVALVEGVDAQSTPSTTFIDADSSPGDNELDPSEIDQDNVIVDAQTSAAQDDDPAEDDYDPAEILIQQTFDLAMTKQLAAGQAEMVAAGDVVRYTITVYNQGSIDATEVTIKDYIPSGMNLIDTDWNSDGTYTISSIPAGGTVSVDIDLQVAASFTGASISNWAEIMEDNGDDIDSTPDGVVFNQDGETNDFNDDNVIDGSNGDEDDHDGALVNIGKFDLSLTKALATTQTDTVAIGDDIHYLISVTNEGDFPSYNVEVIDHIPNGLVLSANDNNNWIQAADNDVLRVIAGPIMPGETVELPIVLEILPTATQGSLRNVAEISDMRDESGVVVQDFDSELENDALAEVEFEFEDDEGAVGIFINSCTDVIIIPNTANICQGATQQLATVGVDPNSTYQWSGPANTLSCTDCPNPVATPSISTTYCVTATEPNGCETVSCVSISVEANPSAHAGADVTICDGGLTQLTATGGNAYQWRPTTGLDNPNSPTPVASPAVTTEYCVLVISATGCLDTDCVTVTVGSQLQPSAGNDVSVCSGSSTQLQASGGINYQWSPTTGLSNSNTSNPIANPSQTTTYCVTVTDGNGCEGTDCVTVTVGDNLVAEAGQDRTICSGSSTQLQVSGGTSYTWSPAVGLSNASSANPTASPSATTTYCVTITDSNGCSGTDCVTVVVENTFANAGNDESICSGSSTTLTATGGNNFSWSPATGLSNPNIANPIANPSTTTTYCVTVTGASGCQAVDCMILNVGNLSATAGSDITICSGDNGNLAASGGTSYQWSPTTGLSNPFVANPIANPAVSTDYTVTISNNGCSVVDQVAVLVTDCSTPSPCGLTAVGCPDKFICEGDNVRLVVNGGNRWLWSPATGLDDPSSPAPYAAPSQTTIYTVTVWDDQGCSDTDEVVVNVNDCTATPACTVEAIGCPDKFICEGGRVRLVVNGGSRWLWSPAIGLDDPSSPAPYASPSQTTTYTIVVTDDNGCTDADEVVVFVSGNTAASAGPDKTICPGSSTILSATGGTSYAWSPATGLSNTNTANPVASPASTTTYTVNVITDDGCRGTDQVTVFVQNDLSVSAGPDQTVCSGGNTQLNASGGVSYVWSPTTGLNNPNIANPIANPSATTTYCVTITSADGCTGTDCMTVYTTSGIPAVACEDKTICLGGTIQLNVTTGASYQWSPSENLDNPTIGTPIAMPAHTTTYVVTVTDANGCTSVDDVTVFVENKFIDLGPDVNICSPSPVQLAASGTGAVYQWSPTTGLNDPNIANPIATPQVTTTYCVTISGPNSCAATDCKTIFVGNNLVANAGLDQTLCNGTTGILSASGGAFYQWSPASGLSNPNIANPSVSPVTTTTYCVTVTDASGCSSTDCMTVNIVSGQQAIACEDKTIAPGGNIRLNVTTGVSYAWSPNSSLDDPTSPVPVATPSTTTTYVVTVTDANGCTSSDDVTVFVDPAYTGGFSSTSSVQLRSRVFLQGSMNAADGTNMMYDKLREKALIPEKEPYTGLRPFETEDDCFVHVGGGNETVDPAILARTGPDAIVDWVFIELHDANDPDKVVATRSALLQRDGDIVEVDGISALSFKVPNGDYFVAVRHRNHLGAMTAQPINLTDNSDAQVDFTNPSIELFKLSDPYKRSEFPMKKVGDYNCLWGGNSNANGTVIFQGPKLDQDKLFYDIYTHPENKGEDGFPNHNFIIKDYCLGDNNMDGELKYQGPGNDIDNLMFFNVILHEENPDYRGNKIIYEQVPRKQFREE